eukprot:scaffold114706_cov48-Phaeocystis_antarctica.AAC.1
MVSTPVVSTPCCVAPSGRSTPGTSSRCRLRGRGFRHLRRLHVRLVRARVTVRVRVGVKAGVHVRLKARVKVRVRVGVKAGLNVRLKARVRV